MTEPAIPSRAARISASGIALVVAAMTPSTKFYPRTLILCHRLVIHVIGSGYIFDGQPQRFKQRDLVLRLSSFDFAEQDIANLALDVIFGDRTFLPRAKVISVF